MALPPFVLASASPARRRLLQMAGIEPLVRPSHFDEDQVQTQRPGELVQRLAQHKANAVAQDLLQEGFTQALVLGCDSILAIHGEIHGKPASPAQAIERWKQMRGQRGELYTGHALMDLGQGRVIVHAAITQVAFAEVTDAQIAAYVATGEPLHCAGGFALEGRGGAVVERIDGCFSNVIGLSLPLLRRWLAFPDE